MKYDKYQLENNELKYKLSNYEPNNHDPKKIQVSNAAAPTCNCKETHGPHMGPKKV